MKKDFKGIDGTVGATTSWDGNREVGAGEQEIKNIVEGEKIETELRFKRPFEGTHSAYFITEAISETQTKVKWEFSGTSKFPLNILCFFMNLFHDMNKDFDDGLSSLKTTLEK